MQSVAHALGDGGKFPFTKGTGYMYPGVQGTGYGVQGTGYGVLSDDTTYPGGNSYCTTVTTCRCVITVRCADCGCAIVCLSVEGGGWAGWSEEAESIDLIKG